MNPILSPTFAQTTLSQVIHRILACGKITSDDHHFLLRAMLSEQPLDEQDQSQVKLVFDRLKMGLLRVVD